MSCHVIMSRKALTASDALREMNGRGFLRNDFILVNGDVVATIKLAPILKAHLDARAKDKEIVMTVVLSEVPIGHRSHATSDVRKDLYPQISSLT